MSRFGAIGILGGSFNPPHQGHRALVLHAMRRAGLSRVRVLVSPQNPLKAAGDYAPLAERLALTEEMMARLPGVSVEPEAGQGPVFAIDTLRDLRRRSPHQRFVYIMGADSFANLHRWRAWQEIMGLVPIAVADRPGHRGKALKSIAALRFSKARVSSEQAFTLGHRQVPAWCFLEGLHMPQSSSAMRSSRKSY